MFTNFVISKFDVNSQTFARILFSRIALKDIFATLKNRVRCTFTFISKRKSDFAISRGFFFIFVNAKVSEITIHTQETISYFTGGKPRNYHEIVLTQICSQATSGTRRGSFQAENWIKKGWCHVHFCFILQLRTNNGEIRQCSSV